MQILAKEKFQIIRSTILLFWSSFWLFNIVDKIVSAAVVSRSDLAGYVGFWNYFIGSGSEAVGIAFAAFISLSLVELIILSFFIRALLELHTGVEKNAATFYFWGTVIGLAVLLFATVGDQLSGDRGALASHVTYWLAILVSWVIYEYCDQATAGLDRVKAKASRSTKKKPRSSAKRKSSSNKKASKKRQVVAKRASGSSKAPASSSQRSSGNRRK